MDPTQALEIIGGTLMTAKVFEKVLGPSADYLGEGIASFAKKRVENVRNILLNAKGKLGDRIDSPGAVPPRVLAGILTDGSYRDDEVACEYYGGVLASSRTEVSRDDRGATIVNLISRLSSYQLRLHYVIYRVFLDLYGGSNTLITQLQSQFKLATFIPEATLLVAMDFSEKEAEVSNIIMGHALVGLSREVLISPQWAFGDAETLRHVGRQVSYQGSECGLVVSPAAHGVELFLHAMGVGHLPFNILLHGGISFPPIEGIVIKPGSQSLRASEAAH
jgi:hypothetical protein